MKRDKPVIPPKPNLTNFETDRYKSLTLSGGKKSLQGRNSPKVPPKDVELSKVSKERKSVGAIKIPGIVQRRNSLSNVLRSDSTKKDSKSAVPDKNRPSLGTLPFRRLDNNNTSSASGALAKSLQTELCAASPIPEKSANPIKDPKRKLSILSKTSPSLNEALKRSNSCKYQSRPFINTRRKSTDNVLDTKSSGVSAPVSMASRSSSQTVASGARQSSAVRSNKLSIESTTRTTRPEQKATLNTQSKSLGQRSNLSVVKSINPTRGKLKLAPGDFQSREIKTSENPLEKRKHSVARRETASKTTTKSLVSKPVHPSESVVMPGPGKKQEAKKTPGHSMGANMKSYSASGRKRLTSDLDSAEGQKGSSPAKDAGSENSKNCSGSKILKDQETILGLKRTIGDNLTKFDVMVLSFQNIISKNEELQFELTNKNKEVKSLKESQANLQVSLYRSLSLTIMVICRLLRRSPREISTNFFISWAVT